MLPSLNRAVSYEPYIVTPVTAGSGNAASQQCTYSIGFVKKWFISATDAWRAYRKIAAMAKV
jgi:hypothetical protein